MSQARLILNTPSNYRCRFYLFPNLIISARWSYLVLPIMKLGFLVLDPLSVIADFYHPHDMNDTFG